MFQSPSKIPFFFSTLKRTFVHDQYPFIFSSEDRLSCSSNISGKTLLSKVLSISSPKPKARVLKKPEVGRVVVHANLKLIERVNIFKDDTAARKSMVSTSLWKPKWRFRGYRPVKIKLRDLIHHVGLCSAQGILRSHPFSERQLQEPIMCYIFINS